MIKLFKHLKKKFFPEKSNLPAGFTLIEVLIVVMVLGILAMMIIPRIIDTSDAAKFSVLQNNLKALRSAVEIYRCEHNGIYPGQNNAGGFPTSAPAVAEIAFRRQMKRYTDINGAVSQVKDATHKYGPYFKSQNLPTNPFNNMPGVLCDTTTTDITVKSSTGTTGWLFFIQTGVLIANDGAHDDN